MKFYQSYTVSSPELGGEAFSAAVPGNVQLDYIRSHPDFIRDGDISYGMEHKKLLSLESLSWIYSSKLSFERKDGESLFFVSHGIDYKCSIYLDGVHILEHEGMFSTIEIDLDREAEERLGRLPEAGDELEILIHPQPKKEGAPIGRAEAADSVKPPVSYGWDWHPRALVSGIFGETYIETRDAGYICNPTVSYTLSDDLTSVQACLSFDMPYAEGGESVGVKIISPDGELLSEGECDGGKHEFTVQNPALWWCRGYGKPNLYSYEITAESGNGEQVRGKFGFRRVRLVHGDRLRDPKGFPKSRPTPPFCIELNGVKIFAKGTNYVSEDIFSASMNGERYKKLIGYAVEANMNIFRCWGGSGAQKDEFYSLCDENGIMVWFEFPLACNKYPDRADYLSVLENEAVSLVNRMGKHPSTVLLCGGNELFNSWSGMDDQSLPLRLLNKISYELRPEIPFIPTSPIYGVAHGGYTFIDRETGLDPFELFGNSHATAYTEFGIPSTPPADCLRTFIPEDELFPPRAGGVWEAHHAFGAWGEDAWLCFPTLRQFGSTETLEDLCETSQKLAAIGYKAIFEAARIQKPHCSMALNWCWCEPWKCAVNNSLIAYPDVKKAAYYAVKESLGDILPALKIPKYTCRAGEKLTLPVWLLCDCEKGARGKLTVTASFADVAETVLGVFQSECEANKNSLCGEVCVEVPDTMQDGELQLSLVFCTSDGETVENRYSLPVIN